MNCEAILGPGAHLGDFRVEHVLRTISGAVVYEATQVSLERRVALTVLDMPLGGDRQFFDRFESESRRLASLDHPHLPTILAAGRLERGPYVATRLVRGSALTADGRDDRKRALALLAQVASALDAAHAAGLVHRALEPSCMLVSGERAFLTDFRLGQESGGVVEDRVAFTAVLASLGGQPSTLDPADHPAVTLVAEAATAHGARGDRGNEGSRRGGSRRAPLGHPLAQAGLVALALAVAGVAVGVSGGSEQSPAGAQPPPVPAGARTLGSDLARGAVRSVDCIGSAASSNSPSCTVMQARLPGRRTQAEADGVVVSWSVRGARGDLALQVLRPGPDGYTDIARTPFVTVPDGGVHRFRAAVRIGKGDRVGVELRPGSAIGVREGPPGTATKRWIARLNGGPLPSTPVPGAPFDHELLVSAAYVPGRDVQGPPQLTGRLAAAAPAGRVLASLEQELPEGTVRELRLVRLDGEVVLDLFAATRRVARLKVPDADPAGRLLAFVKEDRLARNDTEEILRWRNPGSAEPLVHTYRIAALDIELID